MIQFDTAKWVTIYTDGKVLSKNLLPAGAKLYNDNGKQTDYADTEAEANQFILDNNLKPLFYGDWEFQTKYRFHITYPEALNEFFDLVQYAKSDGQIITKEYSSRIMVYVNWFYDAHYQILKDRIELKEGITEIDIR
jgi:hypothetical protein